MGGRGPTPGRRTGPAEDKGPVRVREETEEKEDERETSSDPSAKIQSNPTGLLEQVTNPEPSMNSRSEGRGAVFKFRP